jgi:hypothetical protein
MSDLVPSYLRKIARAEKHLNDLKPIIASYVESQPYVLERDDNSSPYRIHMTSGVPRDIPLISGDFIYNIRSALDHLAAALNPPSRRRSVYFPIFWSGVWDEPVEGEETKKTEDRQKWLTSTREMAPRAVEIIKRQQPDYSAHNSDKEVHFLHGVNLLSNYDKHFELPAILAGVGEPTISWIGDGMRQSFTDSRDWGIVKEGTPVSAIPLDATDVQIDAKVHIVIRVTQPKGEVSIPGYFDRVLEMVRDRIAVPLSPYLYVTSDPGSSH